MDHSNIHDNNTKPEYEENPNFDTKRNNTSDTQLTQYNMNNDLSDLDLKISQLMVNEAGSWICTECGKTTKYRCDLVKHVEGIHIVGVSHPCSFCSKTFRSRNSLKKHISVYHKQ